MAATCGSAPELTLGMGGCLFRYPTPTAPPHPPQTTHTPRPAWGLVLQQAAPHDARLWQSFCVHLAPSSGHLAAHLAASGRDLSCVRQPVAGCWWCVGLGCLFLSPGERHATGAHPARIPPQPPPAEGGIASGGLRSKAALASGGPDLGCRSLVPTPLCALRLVEACAD